MIQVLVGIAGAAALFAIYGLMSRGRTRSPCHGCSCRGGVCERTGEPRHLELTESSDGH